MNTCVNIVLKEFQIFDCLGSCCQNYQKKLDLYRKGITTLGEREEEIVQYEYPIFIICPDPGFKISKLGNDEKPFWYYLNPKMFKNESIQDVYKNTSFNFGEDWVLPGLQIGANFEELGENIEVRVITVGSNKSLHLFIIQHKFRIKTF